MGEELRLRYSKKGRKGCPGACCLWEHSVQQRQICEKLTAKYGDSLPAAIKGEQNLPKFVREYMKGKGYHHFGTEKNPRVRTPLAYTHALTNLPTSSYSNTA